MIWCYSDYLAHHGIMKQKWGVRNGPPYPLKGGQYSYAERKYKQNHMMSGKTKKKKYQDQTLKKGKMLSTLSYDKNRTKDADMFFAAYNKLDAHQYNALFNKPVADLETGKKVMKWNINNKLATDMKVASEKSSAKAFMKLYENDRDFYNFVNDEDRMAKYFKDAASYRKNFKGYKEALNTFEKTKRTGRITDQDLTTIYRLFNYVIPYDGSAESDPKMASRAAKDMLNNRKKFFNQVKKEGYGAILDTNDALYGKFKSTLPVIVVDQSQIIPDKIKRTNMGGKAISSAVLVGRRLLGA